MSFIAGVGAVASVAGSGILSGIKTLAGGYIKGTLFIQLGRQVNPLRVEITMKYILKSTMRIKISL